MTEPYRTHTHTHFHTNLSHTKPARGRHMLSLCVTGGVVTVPVADVSLSRFCVLSGLNLLLKVLILTCSVMATLLVFLDC